MIRVDRLSYRYPGQERDALTQFSAVLEPGSVVAVMGSNGSGKSTLARCLNGLLKPTAGRVSVDGLDPNDDRCLPEIRRRVAMVFQDPRHQMTSASVERELAFGLENLNVPPEEMRRRVGDQARAFGLERSLDLSPTSLSAGDMQRLAVASVLILRPAYLLLDEATSLLSVQARKTVIDAALTGRTERNMGVLLITQFPSEAVAAERLIVLHEGRTAIDGSPAEVFERNAAQLTELGVAVPLKYRLGLPK